MKVKVDATDLAAGGREQVANFKITSTRQVQVDPLIRADFARIRDRQNRTTTVTFEVNRLFDTVADAENFVLIHGDRVPTSGLVAFESEDGTITRWMEAAVIQTVDSSFSGVSTKHSYQMTGGEILSAKPT